MIILVHIWMLLPANSTLVFIFLLFLLLILINLSNTVFGTICVADDTLKIDQAIKSVCVCKPYILEKLVAIQKFIWSFIAHFRSLTSHIILKDFMYKQNIPRRLNKDSSSIHTRIITAFITRNSLLVLATRNLQLATRNSHSHSHAWRLPCSSFPPP
jgi:hypothetical protein